MKNTCFNFISSSFLGVFFLSNFCSKHLDLKYFILKTSKEAQCTNFIPLNNKVTCDFVFSFPIYKSWKSNFRIFQNVFNCLQISAGFVNANSTDYSIADQGNVVDPDNQDYLK